MRDIAKLLSKNVSLSLVCKLIGLVFSILIVSLATDRSNVLLQQILLFQVSIGYFSIFDMGVPSHLKSKAYNGGSNNSFVWLVWLAFLALIFATLAYAVSATMFKSIDTNATVAAIVGAIFIKFAIGYLQSNYYFTSSYVIQIWIPFLLVIYLLSFEVLSFMSFYTFILAFCVVLIIVFIRATRSSLWKISAISFQDLRGGMAFFGAQVLTVLVFGLHEYIFLLSGQTYLGWSIESRYYLFISALGPVISNLFWAYLPHTTAIQSLKILFITIAALLVWGCLVLVFRDEFFDLFWTEHKNSITASEGLFIWVYYISHTVCLFVSGYLYAVRKEHTVFWTLCILCVVRAATLNADLVGMEKLTIYQSNSILGAAGFVLFISVYTHHFIRENRKAKAI